MSGTVVRVIWSVCLILGGSYWSYVTEQIFRLVFNMGPPEFDKINPLGICVSIAGVSIYVMVWLMIWRNVIVWTPQRKTKTGLSILGALLIAFCLAMLGAIQQLGNGWELAIYGVHTMCLSLFAYVWPSLLCFIWKETPEEMQLRLDQMKPTAITCPSCDYSLKGLSSTACPECGTVYTIDQLIALAHEKNTGI